MATDVITVSGNWSWPTGVTSCVVEAVGGGGAGGPVTGLNSTAGGGKGGGYAKATLTKGVESLLVIAVGTGGAAALTAQNGTPSSVTQNGTVVLRATAGNGAPLVSADGTAGAGATTTNGTAVGTTTFTGGNGQTSSSQGSAGGGAAGPTSNGSVPVDQLTAGARGTGAWADGNTTRHGIGGTGRSTNGVGNAGAAAGGGGGGAAADATDRAGGAGGAGVVAITYTPAVAYSLPTDAGTYAIDGGAAALVRTYDGSCARLLLETGDFLLYEDGAHILLEHSGPCGGTATTLPTDVGTYAVTGSAATFLRGRAATSTVGTYALTGSDATFRRGLVGATEAGTYLLTGTPADLAKTGAASMTGVPGAYVVTGVDVGLRRGRVFLTETGAYLLTGTAAGLQRVVPLALVATPGAYALTGADVAFATGVMFAVPGSYVLDGAHATLTYSAALPPYVIREVLTRRMRRSPAISDEDKWIFHHALQIDLETGVGLVTGEGSVPKVMLRWSDDGGQTWSDEHWVSAGRMGAYQTRAIWQRLGRSRDRVYETTVTSPVQWHLLSAVLHLEPGIS